MNLKASNTILIKGTYEFFADYMPLLGVLKERGTLLTEIARSIDGGVSICLFRSLCVTHDVEINSIEDVPMYNLVLRLDENEFRAIFTRSEDTLVNNLDRFDLLSIHPYWTDEPKIEGEI